MMSCKPSLKKAMGIPFLMDIPYTTYEYETVIHINMDSASPNSILKVSSETVDLFVSILTYKVLVSQAKRR